jgi:hypothetical protein
MIKVQAILEAILEDVNQENGTIPNLFEKLTDSLFFLIKWGGIPMVIYLLFQASRW